MRNAVNGLMKRGLIYSDKFTSVVGGTDRINTIIFGQSAERFEGHWQALQLGHAFGHENERTD